MDLRVTIALFHIHTQIKRWYKQISWHKHEDRVTLLPISHHRSFYSTFRSPPVSSSGSLSTVRMEVCPSSGFQVPKLKVECKLLCLLSSKRTLTLVILATKISCKNKSYDLIVAQQTIPNFLILSFLFANIVYEYWQDWESTFST